MKKQFLLLTVLLFLLGACAPKPAEHSFIKVNADGQFVRDGKPYYFVGTNFCIHIWPYNWSWVKADSLKELLPRAKENTKKYIDDHMVIARKYSKPIVLEEFGFPRDGFSFSKEAPTTARDEYYRYVFDLIRQDRESGGLFAGCNFWAWGGFAGQNPDHVFWEKGDDYTGDPAQEQQGLNSVFATDSTIEIIKAENRKLQN